MFVTIIIYDSVPGLVYRSVVSEVETFFFEPHCWHFDLATGIQFIENATVFPQSIVNVSDITADIAVEPVVVGTAALVGAELLIRPAYNR